MANKIIKTRIQHKHDYEVNWIKAVDFIPLAGEIIIYDAETEELFASQYANLTDEQKATIRRSEAITYVRTKIGNGVDIVTDLPFYSSNASDINVDWNQNDEYQPDYIKNRTHYTDDDGTVYTLDPKYIPVDGETIYIEKTDSVVLVPGAYTDSKYMNLAYTWDQMIERGDYENNGGIYAEENEPAVSDIYNWNPKSAYIWARDYYVVVPDDFVGCVGFEGGIKGLILPATLTRFSRSWEGRPTGTVYIKATTPPELPYSDYFGDCNSSDDGGDGYVNIIVPVGYGNAYKSAPNWSQYAAHIKEGLMPDAEKQFLVANIPDVDINALPDNTTITVNTSNKLSVKDSYKDDVDTYLSRLSETEQPDFMSKTLIAAKNYTDKQLSEFDFIKIVDSLPEEGLENKIYLVPVYVEGGFPTGAPGAYTAGGKFSNLEYTWDELITRESKPYVSLKAGDYADILTTDHDIIVSNNLEGADACPYDCNGKNIVLPESVTYINNYQASAIGILYIKATTPPDLRGTFNVGIYRIVVPQGCRDAYISKTNWSNYEDIIVEAVDIVDTGDQNLFNEWIWVNKNEGTDNEAEYVWEYVSTKSLDIDLTAYVKRTEMTAYVEEKLLTGTW